MAMKLDTYIFVIFPHSEALLDNIEVCDWWHLLRYSMQQYLTSFKEE